jgi:hypothetical protein
MTDSAAKVHRGMGLNNFLLEIIQVHLECDRAKVPRPEWPLVYPLLWIHLPEGPKRDALRAEQETPGYVFPYLRNISTRADCLLRYSSPRDTQCSPSPPV